MELINGGRSSENPKREVTSGVSADSTKWETVPNSTVIKTVLAEYLAIATKAAEAAIDEQASDWAEEAARVLAVGFGEAMVSHGQQLNDEGYEQGNFECKASLGLLDEDGEETAECHRMRAETDAKRKAKWEVERRTRG
jgi:hypothetical protein